MKYILSIDQGTSSTRSIIFNESGKIVGSNQKEHRQLYPKEAWVEHDPLEIKSSVFSTIEGALKSGGLHLSDISSIGITNQRETIVAWNKKTGKPLTNAIVWQCRRTAEMVNQLKNEGYEAELHRKTGLVLDAYFSGTKMKWMLENVEKVNEKQKSGDLAFGTIDSWIIYFLTGNHKTDASNASRTLLYNLQTNEWDENLADIFGVKIENLPTIHPNASSEPFGEYDNIPVRGVLGDQQAALFGQIGFNKGEIKTTYGTGNFTLMNTGSSAEYSNNGLLTTIGWETESSTNYALEGSIFITGGALQWLRDELEFFESYDQIDKIARQVKTSGGVKFVPAFVGLGAPHWDSTARGTLLGITGGTKKSHIIRATLESIAFQTNDLLKTMEKESGIKLNSMRVDGGITKSDILMQKQADLSRIHIEIPRITETTAMGAALMSGLHFIWDDYGELAEINPTIKNFKPTKDPDKVKKELKMWEKAVKRSKNWID